MGGIFSLLDSCLNLINIVMSGALIVTTAEELAYQEKLKNAIKGEQKVFKIMSQFYPILNNLLKADGTVNQVKEISTLAVMNWQGIEQNLTAFTKYAIKVQKHKLPPLPNEKNTWISLSFALLSFCCSITFLIYNRNKKRRLGNLETPDTK